MAVLPDPGRSRAVLIGASTYRQLPDLPAVGNNLSGFRDVLVAPRLGGLPAGNCTVVAELATPVDVYRTLRKRASAAEDTLLVYFAGHGRIGSRNELWLCLRDTDPDELAYSAWPYDELRRVVADSPANRKVVILDCCFSGRALADQAGDEETILGQVGIEGSYLLTATPRNAVALAPPGQRYTAFTGALLGLLNEGIPGGPELLTFAQIYPRLQHTLTSRQLPRPRQQGSDTIAHLALTRNLAYTGRGTGDFHERFTAITAQFSDAEPAVRLAGVHAMAALADDWKQNRQTCVDVLCARLRMPYDPDPGLGADRAERAAYRANREVRHTIIRVITAHLKDAAAVSWRGLNFDFTGAQFDGGDFGGAAFTGGMVCFDDAVFSDDEVSFTDAEFSGGTVSFGQAEFAEGGSVCFDDAVFSGGHVSFDEAKFYGGMVNFIGAEFHGTPVGAKVTFNSAEFSGGEVSFDEAKFYGGMVRFVGAEFSGGTVSFARAEFLDSAVGFIYAEFSGGEVSFMRAEFSGGRNSTVSFMGAELSGGTVSFMGAEFSGAKVSFHKTEFSGSRVDFISAEFSGGRVNFDRAEFSGDMVLFANAGFSGSRVSFAGAEFSGGLVDFADVRHWSHPPTFNWDGEPPTGVELPRLDQIR